MTATEATIASVWCEVLGIEQIGIADDYLEIGFDSVQALRALARLGEVLPIRVPVRMFFGSATIIELGAAIDAKLAEAAALELEKALAHVESLDAAELDAALREPAHRNVP